MQRHGFDVSGLGPRHYVREDIEVPNLLDDKLGAKFFAAGLHVFAW